MTRVTRSALVPFAPAHMYALVNDVARYPEFLPWCRASEVLEEGPDEMVARLHVAWSGVRKSFTTRNRLHPAGSIDLTLVDGPFSRLEGHWRFMPLGDADDACRVELDLDFDFDSAIASAAFGPVFRHIADTLVDSFTRRAAGLHGNG